MSFWQGFHAALHTGLPSMGDVGFVVGVALWVAIALLVIAAAGYLFTSLAARVLR